MNQINSLQNANGVQNFHQVEVPTRFSIASPAQILKNITKVALPLVLLGTAMCLQGTEAGPAAYAACMTACLAATGGAFAPACAAACAPLLGAPTP